MNVYVKQIFNNKTISLSVNDLFKFVIKKTKVQSMFIVLKLIMLNNDDIQTRLYNISRLSL